MADIIGGFSPVEVRKPTTEREKRVAEAVKLSGVDAYNFFEKNGDSSVSYNTRTPSEDGGCWVRVESVANIDVDHLSIVALAEVIRDFHENYEAYVANMPCAKVEDE